MSLYFLGGEDRIDVQGELEKSPILSPAVDVIYEEQRLSCTEYEASTTDNKSKVLRTRSGGGKITLL